jgi:hypothetical protein
MVGIPLIGPSRNKSCLAASETATAIDNMSAALSALAKAATSSP